MRNECAVCEEKDEQRNMKYLDPINDWICMRCLKVGRKYQVTSVEEGKKLTEKIRENVEEA